MNWTRIWPRQVPTKIVFLAYVDLLWPPQKERIKNPARFLLMFAPITRSYSSSFAAAGNGEGRVAHGATSTGQGKAKLPPFRRNRLKFPSDPAMNLAFLRAWQAQFPGDGFDFDYHLWRDHYNDPGEFAVAQVLIEDVRGLHGIGLNGYMSCQVQRAFFPTGLGMTVLGRTLWDKKRKLNTIVEDHLRACFGEGSEQVGKYLRRMSNLFSAKVIRGEGAPQEVQAAVRNWRRIPDAVDKAKEMIAAGRAKAEGNRVRSWEIIERFGEMATLMSVALVKKHEGSRGREGRGLGDGQVGAAHRARPALGLRCLRVPDGDREAPRADSGGTEALAVRTANPCHWLSLRRSFQNHGTSGHTVVRHSGQVPISPFIHLPAAGPSCGRRRRWEPGTGSLGRRRPVRGCCGQSAEP